MTGSTMAIYLAGVVVTSLAAGLALDALWQGFAWPLPAPPVAGEGAGYQLWLGLPALLVLLASFRPIRRRFAPGPTPAAERH